jgi:hypothetical protein
VAVERQHPGHHRGDLVAGRSRAGDGAPRARQPIVLEEADGDVRVPDVRGEELHAGYRTSGRRRLRRAVGAV